MAARGKLSVNRGGSARGGFRVETVILAALADRCRLWIRRGCQATTGTDSSKRDRGSAGCWSLGLVAGLILPKLAGTNSGRRWSGSWRLVDRTPLAPIRLVRIWIGGTSRSAPVIREEYIPERVPTGLSHSSIQWQLLCSHKGGSINTAGGRIVGPEYIEFPPRYKKGGN